MNLLNNLSKLNYKLSEPEDMWVEWRKEPARSSSCNIAERADPRCGCYRKTEKKRD